MAETKALSLSQLNGMIADTLDAQLGSRAFWVTAELSDIRNYPDRRYCFFRLLEKQGGEVVASADAVIWRNEYPLIARFEKQARTSFAGNLRLLLLVMVTFNPRYGMRLQVTDMDAGFTLGQMELERQQILDRLVQTHPTLVQLRDGQYRSVNVSRRPPAVISRIALITAPDSDGLRDFMHELEGSGMQFSVSLFASQVQGAGASEQLSSRVAEIAARGADFDIIAMVRGGGSSTDLNVFDDYQLALEIAGAPLPVFTGIGHERNVSIADMMAHTASKTPTKAAAEIVIHNQRWLAMVIELGERLFQKADRRLDDAENRIHAGWQRILMQARWKLERAENQIRMLGQRLELAHPARLGAQGFAKVFRQGKALRPDDPIEPGDILQLQFGNRVIETEVRNIKTDTDG
jgi:exodeoxyribonuclease VII large subunit